MLDNWQRIEQIIKWSGVASVSAFAREIGLNRGENLYQIKRGNNGISKELAEIVTAKYPSLSKAWILTGEGDMVPSKALRIKYDIPFYKADAAEFVTELLEMCPEAAANGFGTREEMPEPAYYISFPMLKGADFASFTFSDSMHPAIPRGAVVFFQYAASLTPGETYLVVSETFTGIRIVRSVPGSGNVRLVAENTAGYDEMQMASDDIKCLFIMKGILINK